MLVASGLTNDICTLTNAERNHACLVRNDRYETIGEDNDLMLVNAECLNAFIFGVDQSQATSLAAEDGGLRKSSMWCTFAARLTRIAHL